MNPHAASKAAQIGSTTYAGAMKVFGRMEIRSAKRTRVRANATAKAPMHPAMAPDAPTMGMAGFVAKAP
jgi:hypothetical protein